jgi:hypothetical protein
MYSLLSRNQQNATSCREKEEIELYLGFQILGNPRKEAFPMKECLHPINNLKRRHWAIKFGSEAKNMKPWFYDQNKIVMPFKR